MYSKRLYLLGILNNEILFQFIRLILANNKIYLLYKYNEINFIRDICET